MNDNLKCISFKSICYYRGCFNPLPRREGRGGSANDLYIAVLLHFYEIKYLNSKKSQMSKQKAGMVLEVTLVLNSKMNIVTKFQVPILTVGYFTPPPYLE